MGEEEVTLTPEEAAEVEALEKMFETTGWDVFLRAQRQVLDSMVLGAIDYSSTPEQFWRIKGSVETLRSVLGYETAIAARKASWEIPSPDHDPVP